MKKATGLRRLINATGYSMAGLAAALRGEAAFRQEMLLAAVMIPAAFVVGSSPFQVALLAAVIVLVLVVELLNSAIEAVVDRIGEERHPLSAQAKDMGSAAVLLALLLAAAVWGAALWQNFRVA